MSDRTHLLFVCTANLQRSPTAESLFGGDSQYEARSCGTHTLSQTSCSEELIQWADVIFCMETRHKQNILERFPEVSSAKIKVLDIPDVFQRDDPQLIRILKEKLDSWLE